MHLQREFVDNEDNDSQLNWSQTEIVPCAKHSKQITLISCNFDVSFNIAHESQMFFDPNRQEKQEDTMGHSFITLLLHIFHYKLNKDTHSAAAVAPEAN